MTAIQAAMAATTSMTVNRAKAAENNANPTPLHSTPHALHAGVREEEKREEAVRGWGNREGRRKRGRKEGRKGRLQ